jgi:hypothetical protein
MRPTKSRTPAPAKTLDALIREQGVKPVADLDALGALWPQGDDPQEFEAFITAERKKRRQAVRK